jgi:hypothetical protein
MPSDAISAMAAKREMPAQETDDFEWVNAWAASAMPSAAAVAPETPPPATAIAPKPVAANPPALEPACADGPERAFLSAPRLDPAADADADAASGRVADAEPVSLPEPATSEMVELAPSDAGHDAALARFVPEETGDQHEAATATSIDHGAVAATVAPTRESDELTSVWAADETPAPSAPISFLDFARRARRNLFRIVARNPDPQPQAEAVPLKDIPELSDPVAADATLSLVPDIAPDQLERDIAEIEMRRDALYAEWERSQRGADPAARSRTSDYVPILLGTVLGFTLLVVFGAAASFVSLR